MTTSKESDASAQSTLHQGVETARAYSHISSVIRKKGERLLLSPFAFPLLFGLFALDHFLPFSEGIFLLIGVLVVGGLCAEEYAAFLRTKGLPVPSALGFYAALMPLLIAFCWRSPSQPAVSLGLLTVITLCLVFCTLMLALSLITEVCERLITGLTVFCLACVGGMIIGLALAHLLLLTQIGLGPRPPLAAMIVGWALLLLHRTKKVPAFPVMPLTSKFQGLAVAAVAFYWGLRAFSQ
ncbi:MAG: hypothetical protein GTO55_01685 [Armatimonadetes bacterium]|nr:hypothetical protein [Armatimonadota bacterium]NIM22989.1 hypothetical protein [Armatimonadota bacterium]NIM66860.1 hypothetical protein [Armatimonadota bacterium]NIM75400.1 hypothetical protein [Armatimonadota bacterium]NIN05047.1 hypothetical protein [Armatimonadota bacterium]